jgi:hypothetical protein
MFQFRVPGSRSALDSVRHLFLRKAARTDPGASAAFEFQLRRREYDFVSGVAFAPAESSSVVLLWNRLESRF